MLDREAAKAAAEALTIAIVALFEEGLDRGARRATTFAEYSDRARLLRGLADDALVLTAALLTLARRGEVPPR